MRYDFSGPFMSCAIVNPDGRRLPLWINDMEAATLRPEDVADDVPSYPWVTNATVELSLAEVPKITVELAPPFREGMRFLDEAFEWGRSRIEVQFGYASGTSGGSIRSPVWSGLIQKPNVSIGADISITLNGQGTGGHVATRQQSVITSGANQRLRDVITAVAAGPRGDSTMEVDFSDADLDERAKAYLDGGVSYTAGRKTRWQVLWELCEHAGCTMLLIGDSLKVLSRHRRLTLPPSRVFRLFDFDGGALGGVVTQQTGETGQGEYPIINFTSDSMAVWLPGAVFGQAQADIDSSNRRSRTEIMSMSRDSTPQTGEGTVEPTASPGTQGPPNEDTEEGQEQVPGSPDLEEATQAARGELERYANMGLHATVDTVGVPDMLPGEIVSIQGVGNRFSGSNYAVERVTHQMGSGGMETNFDAITNIGRFLDGLRGTGPTSPPPNTQEGDAGDTVTVLASPESESDFQARLDASFRTF